MLEGAVAAGGKGADGPDTAWCPEETDALPGSAGVGGKKSEIRSSREPFDGRKSASLRTAEVLSAGCGAGVRPALPDA